MNSHIFSFSSLNSIHSPFGFAGADKQSLIYMREAEIKHSRLAMLAVVGWPLAELWDKPIADAAGLPSLLTKTGESPSLLNGGLDKIDIAYWVAVVGLAGIVELENADAKETKKAYIPGDCNFDPLNLFPKDKEGQKAMMTKEIKHGRIAMMAILGFAIQEALYNQPVVQETPFFFTPAI
jgi:Chlorophyll A-B binding protein